MSERKHKAHLYELFASVTAAIANPHRLELIDLLVQAPRTVEELATEAHMSVANTSQHLQRLKQAHLVESERDGLHVRYSIADPSVARLWLELRAVGESQIAELEPAIDAYRPQRHAFDTLSLSQLRAGLQSGEITLIDVRPTVEYVAGHLPEALSIPIDDVADYIDTIPNGKTIVAYCRGPYCAYADDVLALLVSRGQRVARLEEGVAEWQEAGFDLERNEETTNE